MVSALVYLTLGVSMLARLARPALLKCYILAAAMLLTLLIGCSRVYLGTLARRRAGGLGRRNGLGTGLVGSRRAERQRNKHT